MTGPTREAAASLVRFVSDFRHPRELPRFFMLMVTLLQLEPEEIQQFGDECNLEVGVVRLPVSQVSE